MAHRATLRSLVYACFHFNVISPEPFFHPRCQTKHKFKQTQQSKVGFYCKAKQRVLCPLDSLEQSEVVIFIST
jgi:hypothetical protein